MALARRGLYRTADLTPAELANRNMLAGMRQPLKPKTKPKPKEAAKKAKR